ncbi:hypothetical protein KCV87_07855 [Actinosynnema pretiosum subsp. pretiosum]|uniref:Uncharacterized protein n=2 Tax=Actinosynnema TaxID=40566 RepID=C6WL20_ACTMD|nr:hypothetical protein [Actinosynnema mirum]ACU36373.1 hypothetical protein Amir_2433 [Actinosynnema mirum DSM 43827]AXX29824.1 hypothetical protein APASM_2459 [Actinosynnema pretiosum subsp. pretiosum]QUF05968.1 hypothetical protein KCV87_07855 [Actinosynnema pretiosum subsp. pretiosum]
MYITLRLRSVVRLSLGSAAAGAVLVTALFVATGVGTAPQGPPAVSVAPAVQPVRP